MAYPNQYTPQYPYQYQPQVVAPMDRLAQLQAQQYNFPTQMSGACQQPPQTNQGLLWVQGEAGAKSFLVAPNTTVLLMDSDDSIFYLKSADGSGMPSLRVFKYLEVQQNAPKAPQSAKTNLDDKYVTREEYIRLQAKYEEIMDKLNGFHANEAPAEDAKRPAAMASKSRGKGGNADE